MLSEFLNNYKTQIFVVTVVMIHYVLYILIYLNINIVKKEHVDFMNTLLQICISLFLIYRFAYMSHNSIISNLDKKIIVTSATIILINVLVKDFANYEEKLRNIVSKKPVISKPSKNKPSIYEYLPL